MQATGLQFGRRGTDSLLGIESLDHLNCHRRQKSRAAWNAALVHLKARIVVIAACTLVRLVLR